MSAAAQMRRRLDQARDRLRRESRAGGQLELPGAPAPEPRIVGTCGSCLAPVVLAPAARVASCPCGDTSIPRKFLAYGERSTT